MTCSLEPAKVPQITSEWPLRYLVALSRTMSNPSRAGLQHHEWEWTRCRSLATRHQLPELPI